jgi:hypothetical protein
MPRRRADRLFDIPRILRVLTYANLGCHHGPRWGRNPRSPLLNRWPLSTQPCLSGPVQGNVRNPKRSSDKAAGIRLAARLRGNLRRVSAGHGCAL